MSIDSSAIVFSLDVDWVNDEILDWTLNLFKEYGYPVTVFATHDTELLKVPRDWLEIGIHPNFFHSSNHEKSVTDILNIFPDAKGVRSHGLFEYANLMSAYKRLGLNWDSSQLLYLCPHIRLYHHPSGLMRLPIFWEDDDYFASDPDWKLEGMGLEKPGIKCFAFHPIHLYLNTFSPQQYIYVKEKQFSRESIRDSLYKSNDKGTLVFFKNLLDYIEMNRLPVATIGEICSKHI